jgi:hypothetical protein
MQVGEGDLQTEVWVCLLVMFEIRITRRPFVHCPCTQRGLGGTHTKKQPPLQKQPFIFWGETQNIIMACKLNGSSTVGLEATFNNSARRLQLPYLPNKASSPIQTTQHR